MGKFYASIFVKNGSIVETANWEDLGKQEALETILQYLRIANETNKTYKLVREEENVVLTKEEQARVRKAAQKEFKTNLKKAKKAEEEYNQAYNEAYNNYLRKLGYEVKEPWTWKRVKNTIIAILVIVVVCWLIWIIPPTRQILVDFYNENYIVKALVDIVKALVNAILGIFK